MKKRGKHSLSHYRLLTCDMGELIPCGHFEVLPGDTVQQASSALVRFNPMVAPVMHQVNIRMHHFFVPYRLIWDNWDDFITGGEDGLNASVFPTIGPVTYAVGDLGDYLGLPTGVSLSAVSALPFRAYNFIYNEWYRDQDLQTKAAVITGDGVDGTTARVLKRVCWEKDYFTSARSAPQKGNAVTLALGGTAPIIRNTGTTNSAKIRDAATGALTGGVIGLQVEGGGTGDFETGGGVDVMLDPNSTLLADLASATGTDVIAFRRALGLQRFQEARARFGARYTEYLRYLGINAPDSRLERPEYLGGGRTVAQISEVLQTAPTTSGATLGVADLKGHGIGALRSRRYRRFFDEHGIVMSMLSVVPRTMYYQGLHRSWSRTNRNDFYQPELEMIGQQQVYNREIYAAAAVPGNVFGWQDRFDEYRRHESGVSGEFRNTTANFWHFGREFGAEPALNASFVEASPTKRTFAVTSTDGLQIAINHSIQARRLVKQRGDTSALI